MAALLKVDDTKIQRNVSHFFPPHSYLLFRTLHSSFLIDCSDLKVFWSCEISVYLWLFWCEVLTRFLKSSHNFLGTIFRQ